jgi:uncharacterized membrane protein
MFNSRCSRIGAAVWDETYSRSSQWDGVLGALALAVIVALFLVSPGALLDKADRAAYAVCHRILDRSFVVGGRQLPLCARCSGTYLGALAGFAVLVLRGRGRAAALPVRRYLLVLSGFLALWLVDGANSYLTMFPGLPHLYEPSNLLRLITGTLEGLVMASLMLPVLNLSFWRAAPDLPSLASGRDLLWLLVGGALVVAVVDGEWPPLLYPLALLSGLMVLLLVGAINMVVVLMLWRREGRASSWPALLSPCLLGLALAMLELAAIGLFRAELTVRLGLPF